MASSFFTRGNKKEGKAKFDKNKNLVEEQLREAFKAESQQSNTLREQLRALESEHGETLKQLERTEGLLKQTRTENETIRALLSREPEDARLVFNQNEELRSTVGRLTEKVAALEAQLRAEQEALSRAAAESSKELARYKEQNKALLEERNKFEKIVNETRLGQLDQNFKDKSPEDMQKECHAIFHKQLDLLPCHKDLPRLARNMNIIDMDGNIVAQPNPDDKVEDIIKSLLVCGAARLDGPAMQQTLLERWIEFVPEREDKDLIKCLFRLLKEGLTEESRMVGVLKAANQSVIAPVVAFLQAVTQDTLQYNSAKNGWRIQVLLGEQNIHVTHKRSEKHTDASLEQYGEFTFEWHIDFILNTTASELLEMQVRLKNVKCADAKKEQLLQDVLNEAFRKFHPERDVISLTTGLERRGVKIV